jgi:hypothetical protein
LTLIGAENRVISVVAIYQGMTLLLSSRIDRQLTISDPAVIVVNIHKNLTILFVATTPVASKIAVTLPAKVADCAPRFQITNSKDDPKTSPL